MNPKFNTCADHEIPKTNNRPLNWKKLLQKKRDKLNLTLFLWMLWIFWTSVDSFLLLEPEKVINYLQPYSILAEFIILQSTAFHGFRRGVSQSEFCLFGIDSINVKQNLVAPILVGWEMSSKDLELAISAKNICVSSLRNKVL